MMWHMISTHDVINFYASKIPALFPTRLQYQTTVVKILLGTAVDKYYLGNYTPSTYHRSLSLWFPEQRSHVGGDGLLSILKEINQSRLAYLNAINNLSILFW